MIPITYIQLRSIRNLYFVTAFFIALVISFRITKNS